ncbi:MAG: helix-turn-helix transcriptional regulator, partial [Chloroflexota bacterium]
ELPRHGGHDPADPIRCHVLLFALRVLGSEAPAGLAALPPVLRLAPERWAAALRAAEEVYRELAGRQPGHTLLADSAMARLVGLLWREAATQDTLGRGTLPAVQGVSRLAPVFSYVAAHVTERLTLAELARLVHLSPAHFSTTFRRATGLSPFQYVQRYRLQRAKEILTEDSKSVGEVAAAVGFPDPSYFSRAFKRAEGLSPARYRMAKKSPLLP